MYVPVVPLYNWSGFYIGGNLGAGWNSSGTVSDTFGSTFSTSTSTKFLGGGQVGVNYEFWGGVVVGAEAMFDWLPNTSNTISVTNAASGTASATINNRWLTTATGKLGYAWDRVLVYGKGVVPGSAQAILRLRPMVRQPRSPVLATTILAGLLVSASSGRSPAIGQRGPSGTISSYRTRALLSRAHRHRELCGRRDQRQQSQHQHVHRRCELQVRRLGILITRARNEGCMTPSLMVPKNEVIAPSDKRVVQTLLWALKPLKQLASLDSAAIRDNVSDSCS
jgi:hypothetical protein